MSVFRRPLPLVIAGVALIAIIVALTWSMMSSKKTGSDPQPAAPASSSKPPALTTAAKPPVPVPSKLPDESKFRPIAESSRLQLSADPATGHFTVRDKTTGNVWRSFPDPQGWTAQMESSAWKSNLLSPFIFTYVELGVAKDAEKESNLYGSKGRIAEFTQQSDGFKIVYEMPEIGFIFPIQVRLKDDYVETRIIDSELADNLAPPPTDPKKKDPKTRLVSIRLFPFLGAETSDREDGYLLIPDGPGALIDFKKDKPDVVSFYNEPVYGEDWAFSNRQIISNRLQIRMPIFGIKSASGAVLGVITGGEEYANVFAVPSQTFTDYNWATPRQNYRYKFFQPTSTSRSTGINTYSSERFGYDRSTRYYFLDGTKTGYVEMAGRYRKYLNEEQGVQPIAQNGEIPLHLSLLGADTKKGFLWDSYLPLTTAGQATEIVKSLVERGVDQMSIEYRGWQQGGNSKYGEAFPVAGGIGGNAGMKRFIEYAHSRGFPVLLEATSYSFNNTGDGGFRRSRDGLRDLSSNIIDFRRPGTAEVTFVSPRLVKQNISDDMAKAKSLGADGFVMGSAIGSMLNTDFNSNYAATRKESMDVQKDIFALTKKELGSVQSLDSNFYVLGTVNHLSNMYDDYSYDLFVDRVVPFAPIALHGLVSYSTDYSNLSGDYMRHYLKGIEYGAEPSFMVTYAQSQDLLKSISSNRFYSTNYQDWLDEMTTLYNRYNEALGGVRNQVITAHTELANNVFQTTYAGGTRVIVNYNKETYLLQGGQQVKGQDFAVIRGG